MTVGELIDKLKTFDKALDITIYDGRTLVDYDFDTNDVVITTDETDKRSVVIEIYSDEDE